MTHFFFMIGILLLLLVVLSISIVVGHFFGKKQLKKNHEKKLKIVTVAESAVFGLLALLMAFTFSGAYERYESRKMHLIIEANAFDKAYIFLSQSSSCFCSKFS